MSTHSNKQEEDRLNALKQYQILDTLPEQEYDDLTEIAAQICQTPIALVSLIDENRQWFKSKKGMEASETAREIAFCNYAIQQPNELLEVPNTLEDERFSRNPLVLNNDTHFRFYAGAPLVDEDGFALGTICVLDTKPKSLTQEQIAALKALSRQVISLMKLRLQLRKEEKTIKKIKKLADERAAFLSSMSHEIRTPLNAIVNSISLMQDEPVSTQQKEYLNILQFSSSNLMALVNDVLDLNKLDAHKIKLEKAELHLKELLRSIQSAHASRAEGKGIKLFTEIDNRIPEVVIGDSVRIAQVLNNLIGNAVKFTAEGFVKVRLNLKTKTDQKVIINIQVLDTGIGISTDQQKRLFKRFNQGDESITRKFGGSGLGLFISKNLLSLMGAELKLESSPGAGSNFSFDLKLSYKSNTASGSSILTVSREFHQMSGKVLMVDDNQLNRVLASKFLEKWGLEVEEATNGLEAVDMVQRHQYDLVLMDLHMPEMDGYTAVRLIREMPGDYYKQLPIIAITASVLMNEKDKVQLSGMQDYIPKPFTKEGFWMIISQYLKKKEVSKSEIPHQSKEEVSGKADELKALIAEYTSDDPEFISELVESFIVNYSEIEKEAVAAISQLNVNLYDDVIHKMKPSCLMLNYLKEYEALVSIKNNLDESHQQQHIESVRQITGQILADLKGLQ